MLKFGEKGAIPQRDNKNLEIILDMRWSIAYSSNLEQT